MKKIIQLVFTLLFPAVALASPSLNLPAPYSEPGMRALALAQPSLPDAENVAPLMPHLHEILLAQASASPAPTPSADPQASSAVNRAMSFQLPAYSLEFGSSEWYLHTDTVSLAGVCVQREGSQGQWTYGPCRDIADLDYGNETIVKGAFGVFYNAQHGNASYQPMVGKDVFEAGRQILNLLGAGIPKLEDMNPPKFVQYLNDVGSLYGTAGISPVHDASVHGMFRYGLAAQLTLTFSTVQDIITGVGL